MRQERITGAALQNEPTKNATETEMACSQMKWQVGLYVNLKLPHLSTDMWIADVQQGDTQQEGMGRGHRLLSMDDGRQDKTEGNMKGQVRTEERRRKCRRN